MGRQWRCLGLPSTRSRSVVPLHHGGPARTRASDKPWGHYDYDLFVRDLHTLITRLDLTDITLVGWSMGGHLGLKYVHEHPERVGRLVITGSGPRFWQAPNAPFGTPPADVQGLVDAIRVARTETIAGLYANNFHRTDLKATEEMFIQTGGRCRPSSASRAFSRSSTSTCPCTCQPSSIRSQSSPGATMPSGPPVVRGGPTSAPKCHAYLLRKQRTRRVHRESDRVECCAHRDHRSPHPRRISWRRRRSGLTAAIQRAKHVSPYRGRRQQPSPSPHGCHRPSIEITSFM
ncbi:alpha/beta fold hydrolase [Rhodococcus sp. WB9]|uniref:alpha/beta fold hydrolase n=1 Tax=Rhodococcus sp. WB9 TaxID=2594007 RepID=UPI0037C76CD5